MVLSLKERPNGRDSYWSCTSDPILRIRTDPTRISDRILEAPSDSDFGSDSTGNFGFGYRIGFQITSDPTSYPKIRNEAARFSVAAKLLDQ